MQHLTLTAALLLLLLSCSNTETEELPPDQWVVVGNDRGSRNEFIDMANIVDFENGNLRVRSGIIPTMELNFPVRDSVVIGPRKERWRLSRRGQDSLALFDSVKNNFYYLERLRVVELDSNWINYPEEHLFASGKGYLATNFIFEQRGDQDQGCYMSRGSRTVGTQRIWVDIDDGFWRTDDRFNQPILSYTIGGSKDIIILIDSIKEGAGLYGRYLDNNIMHKVFRGEILIERPKDEGLDKQELLSRLDFSRTSARVAADSLKNRHTRFTYNGSLPENIIRVAEDDIADLWMLLDEAGFAINVGERNIRQGAYSFHPRANYILLEGGCLNVHYLPFEVLEDRMVIDLPVTLIRPGLKPRGLTEDEVFTGVGYFLSELTIEIPFVEGDLGT